MSDATNPYRPPERARDESDSGPRSARRRLSSAALLGTSFAVLAATFGFLAALAAVWPNGISTAVATGLACAGIGCSMAISALGVIRAVTLPLARRPPAVRSVSTFERAVLAIAHLLLMGMGGLLTWLSTLGVSRGRQLRRRGRLLLPPLGAESDWASSRDRDDHARSGPRSDSGVVSASALDSRRHAS